MRTSTANSENFLIRPLIEFLIHEKWIDTASQLESERFLTRSAIPHIESYFSAFNRIDENPDSLADRRYYTEGQNVLNRRMAYLLAYLPPNALRIAALIQEMVRLGWNFQSQDGIRHHVVEFGSGPGSSATGLAMAAAQGILPSLNFKFALIEQDRAMLQLSERWLRALFDRHQLNDWSTEPFHRKVNPGQEWLPRRAPVFDGWMSSFFLNEQSEAPEALADSLCQHWMKHVKEDGWILLSEPGTRNESRKLLQFRKRIVELYASGKSDIQVLLPCLGHQTCGALEKKDDWCHEEIPWLRPPFYLKLDQLTGLDHKRLNFSYLLLTRSRKTRFELLPKLKELGESHPWYRIVGTPVSDGPDREFWMCGQDGKMKARLHKSIESTELGKSHEDSPELERGDLIQVPSKRGDAASTRLESIRVP